MPGREVEVAMRCVGIESECRNADRKSALRPPRAGSPENVSRDPLDWQQLAPDRRHQIADPQLLNPDLAIGRLNVSAPRKATDPAAIIFPVLGTLGVHG